MHFTANAVQLAALAVVTVFLDRNGEIASDEVRRVLPAYAGSDANWTATVGCVRERFAAFDIDIVTDKPDREPYIHAHFGGLASMKGLDDSKVAGITYWDGQTIGNAPVYVFSQGRESTPGALCRTTAHEIGHALGLDHSMLCSDIMSYCWASTVPYEFQDVAAPCGEDTPHECMNGEATQSSYRHLARVLGLRHPGKPEDPYKVDRRTRVDPYR